MQHLQTTPACFASNSTTTYNRRLAALDAELASSFAPLSNDVSLGVIRLSARDMAWFIVDYLRKQRQRSFWGCIGALFFVEPEEFEEAFG